MTYNRIQVAFGSLKKITGPSISYQYDAVQYLEIKGLELPSVYRVDFCNEGDSETISIIGTADGVQIPDNLLRDGRRIKAYIVLTGTDEGAVETRYEITLPVNIRPEPSDIEPTPAEQQQIDSLVSALNDALDEVDEALTKAMPAGGLAGQVLAKKTDDDYDTEWTDQSGGGGGGTTNYNRLTNKPQINGIELTGNQTAEQLGLATPSDIPTVPVQSVAGKTGAVTLAANDISYDESATYQSGTVGAELQHQSRHLSDKADKTIYQTVSGTTLTLNPAVDNTMYLCGELTELTVTAPATGIFGIRFTSGTTPTVVTLTGITMPDDWPTTLNASTTYEINVLNGFGVWQAWT